MRQSNAHSPLIRAVLGALTSLPNQLLDGASLPSAPSPAAIAAWDAQAAKDIPDTSGLLALYPNQQITMRAPAVYVVVTDRSGAFNAEAISALQDSPYPVYIILSDTAPDISEYEARRHAQELTHLLTGRCTPRCQEWTVLIDHSGEWGRNLSNRYPSDDQTAGHLPEMVLVDSNGNIVGQNLFTSYGAEWGQTAQILVNGGTLPPSIEQRAQAYQASLFEHPLYVAITQNPQFLSCKDGPPSWDALIGFLAEVVPEGLVEKTGTAQREIIFRSLERLALTLTRRVPNLTTAREIAQALQQHFPVEFNHNHLLTALATSGLSGHLYGGTSSDFESTLSVVGDLPPGSRMQFSCEVELTGPAGTKGPRMLSGISYGSSQSLFSTSGDITPGTTPWGIYTASMQVTVQREDGKLGDASYLRYPEVRFEVGDEEFFYLPAPSFGPIRGLGNVSGQQRGADAIAAARERLAARAVALRNREVTPALHERIGQPLGALEVLEVVSGSAALHLEHDSNGGKTLNLRNGVWLIDIWEPRCVPCLKAMPAINALAKYLEQRGVNKARIVSVVPESQYRADRGRIEAIVSERKLRYPVLIVSDEQLHALGVDRYPTVIIVSFGEWENAWSGGEPMLEDIPAQHAALE